MFVALWQEWLIWWKTRKLLRKAKQYFPDDPSELTPKQVEILSAMAYIPVPEINRWAFKRTAG